MILLYYFIDKRNLFKKILFASFQINPCIFGYQFSKNFKRFFFS